MRLPDLTLDFDVLRKRALLFRPASIDFFCIPAAAYNERHPTVINPVADESKLTSQRSIASFAILQARSVCARMPTAQRRS